jgi:Ser/Thr protein kinase RdoA (MazF antagonist)
VPAVDLDAALRLWSETVGGHATLINVSENDTYRVDTAGGRYALRVHRPGYQSGGAIETELAWLTALHRRLPVPRPVAGIDRKLLQATGDRHVVLFHFEPGTEPPAQGTDLTALHRTLGRYAATLHLHVLSWRPPAGFQRPTWTADTILDADGLWGDWRLAPGVEGEVAATLAAADTHLRARLAAYGQSPDRFGLIHADMRLGNLLVDDGRVTLIDFDDSGFGWFVYDLAASLSFIELRPDLDTLVASWLEGYRELRSVSREDVAMIPVMILLRRMALLAWIGSRSDTALARRHVDGFARDTATLATRLLV